MPINHCFYFEFRRERAVILSIEEMTKIAEQYGLDVNTVEKGKGGMFYINEDGEKIKIKPEDFTEDMKSIDFMMSHGFIMSDKIVGKMIMEGIKYDI
jgi:hypothetical protein